MWRSLLGPGVALRRPGLCGSGRRFAGAKAEPEQQGVAHLTRDILEHDLFEFNMMKHETPVFKSQQLPVIFFCIVAAKFDPREARSQSIDSAMALRSFLLLLVARAAAVSVDELAQWFASAQGASDCQWSSHHSLSPSTDHWYPGFNYMTSDARKLAEQAGW